MQFLDIVSASAVLAGLAFTAPSPSVPRTSSTVTGDGFVNPSAQQLMAAIETEARGELSNAPPPPKIANSSLAAFQLVAFNENFEVAFFSSLIDNITTGSDNGNLGLSSPGEKSKLLSVLKKIKAQEELHAVNTENVLSHFKAFAPPPCTYKFPTTDVRSAIALASTFTSVVLCTLQDASQLLAKNGDDGPVRAVSSVVGQEGEQNGCFRTLLGLKPSEKPFLTTSTVPFAFSTLQGFVESCPFDVSQIDIPIFTPLKVLSGSAGANFKATDQSLTFSVDFSSVADTAKFIGGNGDGLFVTYLTGQNLPVSEPVMDVTWNGKVATFEAVFPFVDNVMQGLSIAALTTAANFTSLDDVPAATLAASGLIQVNEKWD